MSGDDPLAPIDMVNKILASDAAILAVAAVDDKGNNLGVAIKGEIPEKKELTGELIKKGVQLGAIIVGSLSQFEQLYGPLQAITIRYQASKILILMAPELRLSFIIRLIASANVDYVINSVFALFGIDGKVKRDREVAEVGPRQKQVRSALNASAGR